MKLQIMGCHAATPRFVTQPSSQVLQAGSHMFLIDCGEGTQMQLRRFRVRFSRIEHIFISHLHGDHFFGLPGLISTFRLLGRDKPLHIYGPRGIREAITLLLKLGDSWTNYPLHFHELTASQPEVIFDDGNLSVRTLPLDHRVYTNGFLFELSPGERKLRIEEVRKYGIDKAYYVTRPMLRTWFLLSREWTPSITNPHFWRVNRAWLPRQSIRRPPRQHSWLGRLRWAG